MKLIPILLALSACAAPGFDTHLGSDAPKKGVWQIEVAGWGQEQSFSDWTNSPYYRTSDDPSMMPVYFLVSTTGGICIVSSAVWAVAQRGEHRDCPSGLRIHRYNPHP
jgi:hypothetical protein